MTIAQTWNLNAGRNTSPNKQIQGYMVIRRATGGVLNRVESAPNENGSDDLDLRLKKRQAHAEALAQGWTQKYFLSESMEVRPY